MENPKPKSASADASFRAPKTVEGRSALILAKVALQTLADLHPEAAAAIDHALVHEIEIARTNARVRSVELAALLEDVRTRLRIDDEPIGAAAEDVWYID